MDAAFPWLLGASALWLAAGLALVLRARSRARRVVGTVLERERSDPSRHPWLAVAACVAAGTFVLLAEAPLALPALGVLALGAALALLVPDDREAECGTDGVRRGWYVRRLEELEEWRLAGDHLRFRLHGEWTSVPLARERQASVRQRLAALAPERESRFSA